MTVVTHQRLTSVYTSIATALGAPAEEAKIFARCMARAELRAIYT